MKRYFIQNLIKPICGLMLLLLSNVITYAQLSPMKSQYYQNPYLVNPAMAGDSGRPAVFLNYASQWAKIDGGPVLLSLSASTPINDKAAIGVNVISDKAGLLRRSQAMGTFAYKVMISDNHNVRFGVSLSWADDRLDRNDATSSGTVDPGFEGYNEKPAYMDGNFGVTYTNQKFQAQFSYMNLNHKVLREFSTVDYATFYSSLSYKIDLNSSGGSVKPLVAFRGVNGHENMWDVAAELKLRQLMFYTMYHSNKSMSAGFGFVYNNSLLISGIYGTAPRGLNMLGAQFDLTLGYTF